MKILVKSLFCIALLVAGCVTDSQKRAGPTAAPPALGDGRAVQGTADKATPQLPDSEASRRQRDGDRRLYLQTKAVAEDLLRQGRYDEAAEEYWKAAIRNPRACKSLLVDFYCSRKSTRTETPPSKYAHLYLNQLAKAICPESDARQLEFPCFALVAREETIRDKTIELWCSRDKDDIERAIELSQRGIMIRDGLFVRKLQTGGEESLPLLSEKEAGKLSGDIRSVPISGWKLCLLDCADIGTGTGVSAQLADDPYLVLCKREFRLMRELCQHLGAKSVEITDFEERYEEVGKHGEAELKVETPLFGGAGSAEYEEAYSRYRKFLLATSAKFNGGRGADKIKRGRENYSPGLKARLNEGNPDYCALEIGRKNAQNQVTLWGWEYSYEENGDKSLMARLKIGCKILGVPIGGLVFASWQETEKWERQKKWYLIAAFPESKVVD